MDNLHRTGNLLEAVLWAVIACICLVQSYRSRGELRKVFGILTIAFLAFGVSDIVETRTGAWWRPFWLLVWKGACLIVIALGFWPYYVIKPKAAIEPPSPAGSDGQEGNENLA